MTRLNVRAVCSSISRPELKRHCVKDGLVRAVIGRCALVDQLEVGEVRRVNVNFTLEHLEDPDDISSEVSTFQRDEVELAKPFLIWHLTSH